MLTLRAYDRVMLAGVWRGFSKQEICPRSMVMKKERLPGKILLERIGFALLFTVIGSLIIIVFSQYRPVLTGIHDLLGRLGLMLVLLIAALLARRNESLHHYWQLIFGLFILTFAVSLDWWIAGFMLDSLPGYSNTPAGLALEKLKTVIIIALAVIVLTRLSGSSLGSIYVQRGDLKRGLTIGLKIGRASCRERV